MKTWVTSTVGARAAFYLCALLVWLLLSATILGFPTPLATFDSLVYEFQVGEVWNNLGITMYRFVWGLAISCVLGVSVGVMMGLSPWWRSVFKDIVLVGLSLPAILWAFLTIVWYGFDSRAQIFAAVLTTTPFVITSVASGVSGVSRDLRDMAAIYGVPRRRVIRHLILPAVAGYVIVGTRIGAIVAWNVVLLSEWFGSNNGIGFRSRYWYDANNFSGFFGWAILFVLILIAIDYGLLAPLERRAFAWRAEYKPRRTRLRSAA